MPTQYEIVCTANIENLPKLHELILHAADEHPHLDEKVIYQLRLAADEVCTNVIEHGYQGIEAGKVTLSVLVELDKVTLKITDFGKPFNPNTVRRPKLPSQLKHRKVGGLGLYFLKEIMDEVAYTSSSEAGNCLVLVKYISK